jgi:hypothetical protein
MNPNEAKNGHAREPKIGERIDHIGSTAQSLVSEVRATVEEIKQTVDLHGRVDRHPYGMIAAAVGVGYVLGGGLFTAFTGRLLKLGLRAAALPMVKEELMSMAEAAMSRAEAAREAAPPEPDADQV